MNRILDPDLIEAIRAVDRLADVLISDYTDTVFDIASAIKTVVAPHVEASSNVVIFKEEVYFDEEWLNKVMSTEMYYESPELGENRDW